MKPTRVVMTLEMTEILEVGEICLDQEAQAALRFVNERVKPQVDAAQKAGCDAQMHLRGDLAERMARAVDDGHREASPAPPASSPGTQRRT